MTGKGVKSNWNIFLHDILANLSDVLTTDNYVMHEELMQGGALKFLFSSEKEAEWSRRALRAPFSETSAR